MFTVERYHDISTGHRVVGHENKCRHLHGHNYRVTFTCAPKRTLDTLGRVIDFSVMKDRLCMWLEENWDHKFLLWEKDPLVPVFLDTPGDLEEDEILRESIIVVMFNPTAENMAAHLVNIIGPVVLQDTDVILQSVHISETRKCAATFTLPLQEPKQWQI